MNLHELKVTRQALQSQLKVYELIKPSCHSCEHFPNGRCDHFNATPPPEWISGAEECGDWVYDSIPF